MWEKLKWNLFGETKIIGWIIGGYFTLLISIGILIIYVLYHFISKYW